MAQSPPTRTNKLVRVAVRYGRGSPAHMSATRQADFVSQAAVLTADLGICDLYKNYYSPEPSISIDLK